ncbi:MAG: diguanylate cyclase [Spirochaetia bacterium]|nr:diguanylate cyclase [Spirochaetia bacterium]
MSNRLVYIVDGQTDAAADIAQQLGHYGMSVVVFPNLTEAAAAFETRIPSVMVLTIEGRVGHNMLTMADLQTRYENQVPLIVVSEHDDIDTRMRAVRCGCREFLTKPVSMDLLIGKIEDLIEDRTANPHHVLIVDEDPEFAGELAGYLENAGMIAEVVLSPSLIMESMIEFGTDLILMNLYFPSVFGMEVAAVLRQFEAFQSVPILFFSQDTDMSRRTAAMHRGGDGFLTLPIKEEDLIAAVHSRLERSRTVKNLIVSDSLTGLMNHTRTLEILKRELNRTRSQGGRLSLALVDINRFKRINDTYGHETGDRVIKSLARLLKQRVWSSDLVGRYGGNKFAVIVKSMESETAARVFNEIRVDFAQVRHQREDGEQFFAVFSCGIAPYPRFNEISSMVQRAERALDVAKKRGGNKIALWKPR